MMIRQTALLLLFLLLPVAVFSQAAEENPAENPEETTAAAADDPSRDEEDTKDTDADTKEDEEKKAKQEEYDRKGAEYVEKTLNYGTHKERAQAIADAKRIKTDPYKSRVLKMLVDNLEDESNPGVLRKSFRLLADNKREDAIGPISTYITHSNEDVQITAIYALKDLEAKNRSGDLKKLLKELDYSENSGIIEALLVTLGEFEDKTLFTFAKKKIKDPNTSDFNRQRLVLFLGNSKTLEAKQYLQDLYTNEDENETIRSYAVNSLSKLGDRSVVPAINSQIDKIDSYSIKKRRRHNTLYLYSISALVSLGDRSAYPRLEKSLKSDSAAVRLKAIEMLEDLKDKRSIDILTYKAKYDQSNKVKAASKRVLKETFDIDLDAEDEETEESEDEESEESAADNSLTDQPRDTQ